MDIHLRLKESFITSKPHHIFEILRGSAINSSYTKPFKELLRSLLSYTSEILPYHLALFRYLYPFAAFKIINEINPMSALTYKKESLPENSLRNALFNALVATSCPHQLLGADSNSMRFSS